MVDGRSCVYLGKSILGRGDSKGKGLRQGCAQYLKNCKEVNSRVRGLGRGVAAEVREVTAVEGLLDRWLVFLFRAGTTEGKSAMI